MENLRRSLQYGTEIMHNMYLFGVTLKQLPDLPFRHNTFRPGFTYTVLIAWTIAPSQVYRGPNVPPLFLGARNATVGCQKLDVKLK